MVWHVLKQDSAYIVNACLMLCGVDFKLQISVILIIKLSLDLMASNLMMIASSALSNLTTRSNGHFDANDADPASRTGILQDTSNGKLTRESEDDCACEGMFELDKAFKQIRDVMTSLQERSSDSKMSNDERDEIVLNLSRSLWNLHMARHYVRKMVEENKSLNLASVPRSTEIIVSHGHATTTVVDENEGTMVPNIKVNLVEDQYERSIDDTLTIENVSDIIEVEVKDSIRPEVLMSTNAQMMPMGVLDVPIADDSSDLGFLEFNGSNGLCDGDLAKAGLQPGHLSM